MALKSYNNAVDTNQLNVTLSIEQFLIAPFSNGQAQSWTPGRITLDNSALPSGFAKLGTVVEDSVQLRIARTKFSLKTGIPMSLQYQATTDLTGTMAFALHSFNPWKMWYALGNTQPKNTLDDTPVRIGTTTYTSVTLASSPSTAVFVGDLVAVADSVADLGLTQNGAQVSSISGLTVYVTGEGFHTLPVTGWYFSKIHAIYHPYGTSLIKDFTLLGVADTLEGSQIVHHFPRVQSGGEYTESLKPTENPRPPVAFDIFGSLSTETWESNTELILGTRYVFPRNITS